MKQDDDGKVFTCPFNGAHKLLTFTKWQFHVTRCGDRRGKEVYRCQFNTYHYSCNKKSLIDHEAV